VSYRTTIFTEDDDDTDDLDNVEEEFGDCFEEATRCVNQNIYQDSAQIFHGK